MLPAFVKIVKPNVQKFNGNPLGYSKFKAAFNVEVDKNGVYDATEKLKFLLDSVKGSAKSCLVKFMPVSDKYEEAWTALQERFGRVDTMVSAAKKLIDQFPTIVKENSVQIRQYQEIVSELIGIFKEHNFLHELSSQVPETTVSKLSTRLCGRWAEFVEGNQNYQPGIHLQIGLRKRQKLVSLSSDGCQRRESGSVQIHLKLIGVSQLTNPNFACLQELQENLYALAVEERSAQFTSPLTTLCRSANVYRRC